MGLRFMPRCDTPAMAAHLAEISKAVDPGAHTMGILDQAGWHIWKTLAIPDNFTSLSPLFYLLELRLVNNNRKLIRDNCIADVSRFLFELEKYKIIEIDLE